eukprot:7391555-Prymnesium_polylepis.3
MRILRTRRVMRRPSGGGGLESERGDSRGERERGVGLGRLPRRRLTTADAEEPGEAGCAGEGVGECVDIGELGGDTSSIGASPAGGVRPKHSSLSGWSSPVLTEMCGPQPNTSKEERQAGSSRTTCAAIPRLKLPVPSTRSTYPRCSSDPGA